MSSFTTFAGANASSAWLSALYIWNLAKPETQLNVVKAIVFLCCVVTENCKELEDEIQIKDFCTDTLTFWLECRTKNTTKEDADDKQKASLLYSLISHFVSNTRGQIDPSYTYQQNRTYLVSIVGVSPRSEIDFFKADEIGRVLSRTKAFYNENIGSNEHYYKLNGYYHSISSTSPQLPLLDDIPVDLKMRLTPNDQRSLEGLYNKHTQHQNQYQNQPERPVLELPPMVVFLMWLYPGDLGGEATKSLKKFLKSNNALQGSLDALREGSIPGYRLVYGLIEIYIWHWYTGALLHGQGAPFRLLGEFDRLIQGLPVQDPLSVLRRTIAAADQWLEKEGGDQPLVRFFKDYIKSKFIVAPSDKENVLNDSIHQYLRPRLSSWQVSGDWPHRKAYSDAFGINEYEAQYDGNRRKRRKQTQ